MAGGWSQLLCGARTRPGSLPLPLPLKQGSIDAPPKVLPSPTTGYREVARTQNSAENENKIFRLSASTGFSKVKIVRWLYCPLPPKIF